MKYPFLILSNFLLAAACNAEQPITPDRPGNVASFEKGSSESVEFFMPADVSAVRIAYNLPSAEIFRIGAVNSGIVKDGRPVRIGQNPLIISDGNALLEGRNITLTRTAALTGWLRGNYRTYPPETKVIQGLIRMRENRNQLHLIADMSAVRRVRICINDIQPSPSTTQKWQFKIYADGLLVPERLYNLSCIDIGARQAALQLESWPPVGSFVINGQYTIQR